MFGSLTGNTCPEGSFYGCGEDDETGFRVEDCFKKNCCPAGIQRSFSIWMQNQKGLKHYDTLLAPLAYVMAGVRRASARPSVRVCVNFYFKHLL